MIDADMYVVVCFIGQGWMEVQTTVWAPFGMVKITCFNLLNISQNRSFFNQDRSFFKQDLSFYQ